MSQIIATLKLIVQILPVLAEMVRALESAVPEGGKGAQKLEVIREVLTSAYAATGEITVPFLALWQAVEKVVSVLVKAITK